MKIEALLEEVGRALSVTLTEFLLEVDSLLQSRGLI